MTSNTSSMSRRVTPGRMARRLVHLPSGLAASGVLAVLAVVIGGLVRGGAGAYGGLAGVGLVAVSYTFSSVVIAWVDIVDKNLIMPIGLALYGVKFTVLGFVMYAISSTGWAGVVPMGLGIAAAVLGWTVAQAWWTYHAKIPYVDTEPE
jgi:hypothetical protein